MKKIIIVISFLILLVSNLNAKNYSMDDIYQKMCIECHSSDGSGNKDKLTPSMIG